MNRLFFASALAAISMFSSASAGNDAQSYPLLKDRPSSDSYVLERVADYWTLANITYSPAGNFFLIEDRVLRKIDASGAEVAAVEVREPYTRLPFTPYIATPQGIYDMSKTRPRLERFVQVVNGDKDRTLTVASFNEIYSQAYADADIVVYGDANFEEGIDKYRAYMWITGDWVLFYLSDQAITVDQNYEFGVTVEEFPAKYNRMILLKDIAARQYSHHSDRLRDRETRLPEDKLRYPAFGTLKLMGFTKEQVDETYRGVPVVHSGTALHRLSFGGEQIRFREIAVKVRGKRLQTQLNWFVLPEVYRQKAPLGFLEFMPGSNMSTDGSGGVYALRRR